HAGAARLRALPSGRGSTETEAQGALQVTMPAPAQPGMPLDDVDTPALIIDLDAFERNRQRMADLVSRYGVRLRPHAKTHKSPIIALKQMARGAVGVCCQKVSEAEVLVRS